jgi:AraC-like DNA-binding protein
MVAARRSSVSTASLPVSERLEYWEHYNTSVLVGLTCKTFEERGLLARETNLDMDRYRVADIAGNAHVIERSAQHVRSHPKSSAFVSLLISGEGHFHQGQQWLQLAAGDLVVYDTDRPYLFGFGPDMRQLLVDVPIHLLQGDGETIDLTTPILVRGDGMDAPAAAARKLRRALNVLVESPDPSTSSQGTDAVLDAVSGLLLGRGPAGSSRVVAAAKAFIEARLDDSTLDVEAVAASVGVSARHLGRLFAGQQGSVGRYILEQRLRRASLELRDHSMACYRISDIAYRWGFASQAHFATAFKKRYGCSPSDFRAEASDEASRLRGASTFRSA